ncbi:MAG: hypothetical protein MHM6MM_002611 [Cercozoa sp. M6MM]
MLLRGTRTHSSSESEASCVLMTLAYLVTAVSIFFVLLLRCCDRKPEPEFEAKAHHLTKTRKLSLFSRSFDEDSKTLVVKMNRPNDETETVRIFFDPRGSDPSQQDASEYQDVELDSKYSESTATTPSASTGTESDELDNDLWSETDSEFERASEFSAGSQPGFRDHRESPQYTRSTGSESSASRSRRNVPESIRRLQYDNDLDEHRHSDLRDVEVNGSNIEFTDSEDSSE